MKPTAAATGLVGVVILLQGCATAPSAEPQLTAELPTPAYRHVTFDAPNFERVAHATELPVEEHATPAEGHP